MVDSFAFLTLIWRSFIVCIHMIMQVTDPMKFLVANVACDHFGCLFMFDTHMFIQSTYINDHNMSKSLDVSVAVDYEHPDYVVCQNIYNTLYNGN